MYKVIDQEPAREKIEQFGMQISEEDSYTNYRIDLTKLSDAQKRALFESYGITAAEGTSDLVLSLSTEI